MRRLIVSLDALPGLREAASAPDLDLAAAATLAELAGVDAVRLGVSEDLKPVREEDVHEARRAARALELRMPPSQTLLKVALATRPDRVVLAAGDGPVELRSRTAPLGPIVRTLGDAGVSVWARIAPRIESLKTARAEGIEGVEFATGPIVDLPGPERASELEALGDAVRLAAKLGLSIGVGGGLGYRNLREVLAAAPAVECVAVGRGAVARAVLVGLDRAVRDLRALVG